MYTNIFDLLKYINGNFFTVKLPLNKAWYIDVDLHKFVKSFRMLLKL